MFSTVLGDALVEYALTYLVDCVQEYEKLHEIEEAGSLRNKKRRNVSQGYGPLMLVVTTFIAMAAGALVGSRMAKKA